MIAVFALLTSVSISAAQLGPVPVDPLPMASVTAADSAASVAMSPADTTASDPASTTVDSASGHVAAPDVHMLHKAELSETTLIGSEPEPRSRIRVVKWLYEDLGGLAQHVATPKFGLYAAGTLAFTFGLAWLDDDARKLMHDANKGLIEDYFLVVDTLGGPIINIPVVAAAGISLLTNNERFQDAAWTSLQTLIYAGALGYMMKTVFGRDRPVWNDDPYAFFARTGMNPFPAEGNSSFPSGHAISSFGIITPWVLYYPNVFTYALYVIPIGTSLSRISHDRHWGTDVVVGTVIGITMARWLVARHKRQQVESEPTRLDVSLAPGGAGLRLTYRLN